MMMGLINHFINGREPTRTNRQWLESLTDEELARMLLGPSICDYCVYRRENGGCSVNGNNCEGGCLNWLRAEHNGVER